MAEDDKTPPADKPPAEPTKAKTTKYVIIVGANAKGPWSTHGTEDAVTKDAAKKQALLASEDLRGQIERGLWMEAVPQRYWDPKKVGVKAPPPPQFDV